MPLDSIYHMYWAIFRMGFRFLAEGIFIYLIVNNINNQNVCKSFNTLSKKKILLFSSFYVFVVLSVDIISLMFSTYGIYLFRLASVLLVFFYSYYKQRKAQENLVSNYNNTQNIWYALTIAVILALAAESFNYISYMLVHKFFVLMGIYDTVRSVDLLHQLYRTLAVFLDAFLMFLVYKFRFIKMKDIKDMSMHKRIPISFAFCLTSSLYIEFICDKMFLLAPHREALLWTLALTLPSYIGFYITTAKLTRLLSIKSNATADENILMWIFNPSVIETTHLNIYDSDAFMSNFESKKLAFKKRLKKLGINNSCRGYSELIFCLILTKLFIGLKGWTFEKDILGQASLVTDVPISRLRKDLENIIEQIWCTSEAEDLINGYYLPYHSSNTYDQCRHPKIEEFLMSIAKSV